MGPLFEIPSYKDIFVGELIERGEWVVGCIDGPISWPTKYQSVKFKDHHLHIIPVTKEMYPAVALKRPSGVSFEDGERIIAQFLSALSWMTEEGVGVVQWSGGNIPRTMMRDRSHRMIRQEFDFIDLPSAQDEQVMLALALLREARFINHPAYAFLSAFRVIETHCKGKAAIIKWINDSVQAVSGHRAKECLQSLQATHSNLGKYLYESGRCAIAHGNKKPVISPDDPTDTRRLARELPLIIDIATRLIENQFGVETGMTIYRKHLYELAGFKAIFGQDLISKILNKEPLTGGVNLETIDVGLRGRPPYRPLCGLSPEGVAVQDGVVLLQYAATDRPVTIQFKLKFADERLDFDIYSDFAFGDDGTAQGAEDVADIKAFLRDYFCNGSLQITDNQNGETLSRKDAFLPMNVIVNVDQ